MSATTSNPTAAPSWLELVRRKVEGLGYGQVYIVVHDHQVTQVECLEKTRLATPRGHSARDERGE
ncbi:MAG TPA: YezD family protein [Opitutales bacterium]|jgi:hypothetical protein|nr:YezD family protein [Opitutales bacterium]